MRRIESLPFLAVVLLAACTSASGAPQPSAQANPAGPTAVVSVSETEGPAPSPAVAPCPGPEGVADGLVTFRVAPDGACRPARALMEYRCGPASQPTLVVRAITKPVDYLGGTFSRKVSSLPGDVRLLGIRDDGAQVFASDKDPDGLFILNDGVIRRWPRIQRFATSSGTSIRGFYRPHAFFLGDSVMLGAETAIKEAMAPWDVTFDAKVSRSTTAGLEVLRQRSSEIQDVVVVQLGTNDGASFGPYAEHVAQVMDELKDVPLVIWLTVNEVRSYYPGTNDTMRQVLGRYPNGLVVDWDAAVPPDGVYADGLHLRPEGGAAMASLAHDTILDWYASTIDRGNNGCRPALVAALRPTPIPAWLRDRLI